MLRPGNWTSPAGVSPVRVVAGEPLTGRSSIHRDIREVITELNPILRGWGNYFRTGNAAKKFNQLDSYVLIRLPSLVDQTARPQPPCWTG